MDNRRSTIINKVIVVIVGIAIGLAVINFAKWVMQYASTSITQGISGLIIMWLLYSKKFSDNKSEDISLVFVFPYTLKFLWYLVFYSFICYFGISPVFDLIFQFLQKIF
jgi:hypothetical protein